MTRDGRRKLFAPVTKVVLTVTVLLRADTLSVQEVYTDRRTLSECCVHLIWSWEVAQWREAFEIYCTKRILRRAATCLSTYESSSAPMHFIYLNFLRICVEEVESYYWSVTADSRPCFSFLFPCFPDVACRDRWQETQHAGKKAAQPYRHGNVCIPPPPAPLAPQPVGGLHRSGLFWIKLRCALTVPSKKSVLGRHFFKPKRSASLLRHWTNIFMSGIRKKYWSNSVWEEAALPRIHFTVKIKEENILCAAA